ncbi:MAG: GDSL-type esterase/lipase family protein [Planctomycetota bacterium]
MVFLGDSITHAGHFVAMVDAHFRSQSSGRAFECINIGLPSETACGLSEPDHPFPRPNVHERLDRALERTKPDIVVACYGMNDGIYYPFSNERFATYRKGIETLIDKVQASGARLVLMTPGPFDPLPLRKKGKLLPKTAKKFAWFGIYENYDKEVIARYSKWILGLRGRVEMVVDLRTPILKHVTEKRKENADYALSNDGVHVDKRGHRLIADALLRSWGETPVKPDAEIFKKAEQREVLLRYAWISHVEHLRPGVKKGLPLEEALKRAKELE